ncbi:MAG: helix-turn-helix transcriptional regulator [Steroidobacteraceae bacterium]
MSSNEKIELGDLVYYRERNRNKVYATVVTLFSRLVEIHNLTKSEIAYRLNKEPAQITRWFSGPSNWTLDTVSDLLLAMGAELDYKDVRIGQRIANVRPHPLLQNEPNKVVWMKLKDPCKEDETHIENTETGTTNKPLLVRVG